MVNMMIFGSFSPRRWVNLRDFVEAFSLREGVNAYPDLLRSLVRKNWRRKASLLKGITG